MPQAEREQQAQQEQQAPEEQQEQQAQEEQQAQLVQQEAYRHLHSRPLTRVPLLSSRSQRGPRRTSPGPHTSWILVLVGTT